MPTKFTSKKITTSTKKTEKPTKGKSGIWPVNSKRITQRMVGGHKGVDVGIPIGTRLVAPEGGTVIAAGTSTSGYGKYVKIRTKDGKDIILGHLSEIDTRAGAVVKEGQLIGLSGNTGNSTGPHVHIEVRKGGGYLDPLALYTGDYKITGGKNITPVKPTTKPGAREPIPGAKAGPPGSAPEPQEEGPSSPFSLFPEIKINWINIAIGLVGIILITVGVTGVVIGESAKLALSPIVEPIKEAVTAQS